MNDPAVNYPGLIVPVGHVEPVPRRVRGQVGGRTVFDTQRALYVWEWPGYPQFCVPPADLTGATLVDENRAGRLSPGPARRHALQVGADTRAGAAWVWSEGAPERLIGTARFRWEAVDAWFEEDEQVFVHPRNPYTRVDALRSNRSVRVEVDGTVLADAPNTVMVFETGLPTRYYLDRSSVDWTRLDPTDTVTACPYKGRTSGYWSFTGGEGTHEDIVWAYDFPTTAMAPIAGLVAFYNEKVDLYLDGVLQPRPAPVTRTTGAES
ncbi:DUF427 domain-containing protein [Streptomyces sp. NBC_01476]|uniref:DUF427 domain-containing protein n=1 Tax=Streptomyces sp. NBC_01476 TaxID=2903881 RepID=UPI002E3234DF|nr:DUF427 domain-containing protein [Streptomyces sp. NBC_01476]